MKTFILGPLLRDSESHMHGPLWYPFDDILRIIAQPTSVTGRHEEINKNNNNGLKSAMNHFLREAINVFLEMCQLGLIISLGMKTWCSSSLQVHVLGALPQSYS